MLNFVMVIIFMTVNKIPLYKFVNRLFLFVADIKTPLFTAERRRGFFEVRKQSQLSMLIMKLGTGCFAL